MLCFNERQELKGGLTYGTLQFIKGTELTCALVVACFVHLAFEQLQTHDGVKGDQEEDQQGDVEQRQDGFQD